MIEFKSVSKHYGKAQVLNDISLKIDTSDFVVLLGASGSGKTTLLKMINGLEEPTSGSIAYNERDLATIDLIDFRRKTGYVIQEVGLFPHYSVYDNIGLIPQLKGIAKDEVKARVVYWMQQLEISFEDHSQKFPHQLSGGQAQRVGLARALASQPQLMLLDEPFSALDPVIRNKIRGDFYKIQKEQRLTTVMVTHDLLEAVAMADKICLIADGTIQQYDTPENIIFKPANKQVAAFISVDKYQASLAACKLKALKPFLKQLPEKLMKQRTLLDALQQADDSEQQKLTEAFNQYKTALND